METQQIKVQGIEVQIGDVVYGVTSAPAHGKWGGYSHAVGYRVERAADGKKAKLVRVWAGEDHTSETKCWAAAKARSELAAALKSGGRRVLLAKAGQPRIEVVK
jgi:hypothetical protein